MNVDKFIAAIISIFLLIILLILKLTGFVSWRFILSFIPVWIFFIVIPIFFYAFRKLFLT